MNIYNLGLYAIMLLVGCNSAPIENKNAEEVDMYGAPIVHSIESGSAGLDRVGYEPMELGIFMSFPSEFILDKKEINGALVQDLKWFNSVVEEEMEICIICNIINIEQSTGYLPTIQQVRELEDRPNSKKKDKYDYEVNDNVFFNKDKTATYTITKQVEMHGKLFQAEKYKIYIHNASINLMVFYEVDNPTAQKVWDDFRSTIRNSISKKETQGVFYTFKGGHQMAKSEWMTPVNIEASKKAYGGEESVINILDCFMTKVAEENYYDDVKVLLSPETDEDFEKYQRVFDKYNLKPILIECVNKFHAGDDNGSLQEFEDYVLDANTREYLVLHLKKEAEKAKDWKELSALINEESFFNCWAEKIISSQGSADLQKIDNNYFSSEQQDIDIENCFLSNMK